MTRAASDILSTLEDMLGTDLPIRVRCWDGSEAGPADSAARVEFTSRRALRRILWSPNELGLARAYVAGDLEVHGDLFALLDVPGLIAGIGEYRVRGMRPAAVGRAAWTLLRLGGVGLPPRPPAVEMRHGRSAKHSESRDSLTVSQHYDVGNEFYRLLLGPSMVYSCGYWEGSAGTLDDAEEAKCDLICRKLGLKPGMRLLDVGCGWGSMAIHAAQNYGVDVVGVTLSQEQVEWAKMAVADAGLTDRVEVRLQDYREVDDGPYDAISSIGMAEHVGLANQPIYARQMFGLLNPGGRLLNHAIASVGPLPEKPARTPSFIDNYVFPDGEILPLSKTVDALERAGLEVRDCDGLREHYALTLRAWVENLRGNWDEAVRLVGTERARTWLLYLAASALGFEAPDRLTINQVLAVRPMDSGVSGMPTTRREWYR
ncbi:SAM-dependent methyltransferase [Tomitella biformata]|uniref:SAM-dependent methyltransferase n=1 Tax=Tomitella biformata TaxID=630403 RepID=UPI000465C406|nr:cyclopropane-fatty-acyl-phospholipid synthase family protein [Tomitella biformata]